MSQTETGAQNQKLTRTDLFSMAIGQIIGVGIMTMTGIAIGFTGRSVNLAYLLEAEEDQPLRVCEAENSGVAWFSLADALSASTEPWFVDRIYKKLNEKLLYL